MELENELDTLGTQLKIALIEMKQFLLEKQSLLLELKKLLGQQSAKDALSNRNRKNYLEFVKNNRPGENLDDQQLVQSGLIEQFQSLFLEFLEYDKIISACLQVLGLDESLENFQYSQINFTKSDNTLAVFASEFLKAYPSWKALLISLENLVIFDEPFQLSDTFLAIEQENDKEDTPEDETNDPREEFYNYYPPGELDPTTPLTAMSHATYHELRTKLVQSKSFQSSPGTPWPTLLLTKGGAIGNAQLRPPQVENQPLMPPDEVERWVQIMWKQREELSDLDADALDLLCHTWLQQARRPDASALAIVDQFLVMRGLKPKQGGQGRRGGFETEQRTDMLRALSHIQSLWLNMGSVEVYEEEEKEDRNPGKKERRKSKAVKKTIESRAFVVTDRMGQLKMDGYMDVERFIFQPGKLFAQFLFGPGRQTALLSAKAVQYDPYRQKWEKRLARYFSWQWRIQSRHGSYTRPYRVITLLEAVEEELNAKRPAITRERLEKALDTLQEDKVLANWQYDRWDEKLAEQRGWAASWLQATVLVEPPEIIREAYKSIEHQESRYIGSKGKRTASKILTSGEQNLQARTRRASQNVEDEGDKSGAGQVSEATSLGEKLLARRKALHLSQSQAAEQLEIAQSYLSKLENNLVKPAPELENRIEEWFVGEE